MPKQTELGFRERPTLKRPIIREKGGKRIRDENWDFRGIPASTGVYGIHPYPAMFHFRVVRKLLKAYSKERDLVFDPFLGSGVSAVESQLLKRDFVGFDINPLAVLISKVRVTPLDGPKLLKNLDMIESAYRAAKPEPIKFNNINYWFGDAQIEDLSKLKIGISSLEYEKIVNFFKVAFSETVRRVSKTRFNEFKLLRKKNFSNPDTIKTFRSVARKNIGLLEEFYTGLEKTELKLKIAEKDILKPFSLHGRLADLIITSPPYGDSRTTVAYGQFSRLSLAWLGLTERLDKSSLGGNIREVDYELPSVTLYKKLNNIRAKNPKRAKEVLTFYADLFNAVSMIAGPLKPGGFVCFVVGNRKVSGLELPTDEISADFFKNLGFKHKRTIIRAISNKRMPLKNAPSNVKGEKDTTMRYEYILILKKG